jgi:peptidoglycan/LPS O-acetylase OafA/YrhL
MPLIPSRDFPAQRIAANPTPAIPEFEGLRGLMAWWVVFGHMAQLAGYSGVQNTLAWPMVVLLRGSVPVDVFITLSGFVIFSMLSRASALQYRPYLLGRFFRLYPAYLVALLLALLTIPLAVTAHSAPWSDPQAASDALARIASTSQHGPEHVWLHLTLLHGLVADQWLPYAGDALLSPAWSLSLEWQFYLVAPLLLLLLRKHWLWWAGACMVVLALKWLLIHSPLTFSYGAFLPVKFEFFILGMGSCMVWQRCVRHSSLRACTGPLLALAACIVAAYAVMAFTGGMREHFFSLVIWLLVFSAALGRAMLGKVTLISSVLSYPVLQKIGQFSYSTYIIHMVLLFAVGAGMVHVLADHNPTRGTVLVLMVVVCSPLILLASMGLYRFVEQPGIQMGKTLRGRFQRRVASQTV